MTITVSGISIKKNFTSSSELKIYKISRKFRRLFQFFGCDLFYDRYSKCLSLYSIKKDEVFYEAINKCINIGS